ncbi:MAG TPA: hypothetical protein VMT11_06710 [Myxococcaceae bacterium]|nr:hypothetical protein [Myxococcaceae bacterium]
MKTKDFNKKIDVVAARAKALNIKASTELHRAVAKAGYALEGTAKKLAASADELAMRAQHLAKQVAPKPAIRKHAR